MATTIDIAAPPAAVWRTLTEQRSYSNEESYYDQWPSPPAIGVMTDLVFKARGGEGATSDYKVVALEPEVHLRLESSRWGIRVEDRLEAVGEGTRLTRTVEGCEREPGIFGKPRGPSRLILRSVSKSLTGPAEIKWLTERATAR